MKKHILMAAIAATVIISLTTSCNKADSDPVRDDYTITLTKARFDGLYHYRLDNVSGDRIVTSAGTYSWYPWMACDKPSAAYPDVYAGGYTDITISASVPVTMQAVTTGDNAVPVNVTRITDTDWSAEYKVDGSGYGAAYVLITAETGASKLVTLGVNGIVDPVLDSYPTSMTYSVNGRTAASCYAAVKEDAVKAAVTVTLGDTITITSIHHDYAANYDVRNTVDVLEGPDCRTVPGHDSPICLVDFSGLKLIPQEVGTILIPLTCRRPDGTYGMDDPQYFAFKVVDK